MQEQFESIQVISFEKKKRSKKIISQKTKEEALIEAPIKIVDQQTRYIQLLERVTQMLVKNNPKLAEKSKIVLKPPQFIRVDRKTIITNFVEVCKQIDRHPEHVMSFFINELGCQGSMGNKGFIIRNVIQQKQIYNIFRKYIIQYVECQTCKKHNTQLLKDVKMRLWTLQCGNCLCRRAVPTIQGSDKKYEDYEKRLINCKKDKENK